MMLSDQGFELLEAEDYETAEDYFKRALEINPDNPYALLNSTINLFLYETHQPNPFRNMRAY